MRAQRGCMACKETLCRLAKKEKEMLTAEDVMTRDVITVTKETPATEVVKLLAENHITGVPVVGHDMALLGMITEKDVLRLLNRDDCETEATVEDFMTTPAIYFDENESLQAISDCLMSYDFRRVPIASRGKLVGIISRHDILMHLLQTRILEPAS